LLGAMGAVETRDAANLLQRCQIDCELLADSQAYRALQARMDFERAQIWTLATPWQAPTPAVEGLTIRPLEKQDSLDQLPEDLRAEIVVARGKRGVLAGFIDGVAVSFAYSLTTETLADLSIDTLDAYRRRGIGRAVVSAHIDELVAAGISPVWGAVESNAASLRLAESLGFTVPAGELFVSDSPC
jgi:GNAT superfamily N-acetyltransferase